MHLTAKELAPLFLEDRPDAATLDAFTPEGGEGDFQRPEIRKRGPILLHLTACPRCRRRLASLLQQPEGQPEEDPASPPPLGLQVLSLVSEIQDRDSRRLTKEEPANRALVDKLLRIPQPERLRFIEEAPQPFLSTGVAGLLIQLAEKAMAEARLADARHLAFLATSLLEAMPDSIRASKLLVLGYCVIADVEMHRGVHDTPEELLQQAVRQTSHDQLLDRSRARLSLSLGRLRQNQGRIDEALALFERAQRIQRSWGRRRLHPGGPGPRLAPPRRTRFRFRSGAPPGGLHPPRGHPGSQPPVRRPWAASGLR